MIHACSEFHPQPRPLVLVADAADDSAARTLSAIEQCGADAVRLRPSQNFEALVLEQQPALLVVDIDFPGPRFGITLIDLALQLTKASIIVMGSSLDSVLAARAASSTRCHWLQRPIHDGQLTTTIRLALMRPRKVYPRAVPISRTVPERRRLRPREREIAELLLNHYRVPAVAAKLSISAHTVRNHLKNIYRRWGVRSQQELLLALREVRTDSGIPDDLGEDVTR